MSGSSTVNVSITADAAQLQAAMQSAIQSMTAFQSSISSTTAATASFTQTSSQIDQQLRQLAQVAQQASAAINQMGASATQAAAANSNLAGQAANAGRQMGAATHMTTGFYRELLVVGHEAMSGRFSRIPGSLMVLTERMGGLTAGTMGLVGALGLAAIAAYHLVAALHEANVAKEQTASAAAFFNPQINEAATNQIIDKFKTMPGYTAEVAGQVASDFARMQGASAPVIQGLMQQVKGFADATGETMPKAAQQIKSVFESPTEKGAEFLNNINASTQAIERFNAITGDNATAQRRVFILQQLSAANERVASTTAKAGEQQQRNTSVPLINPDMPIDVTQIANQLQTEQTQRTREENQQRVQDTQNAVNAMSNIEKSAALDHPPTWFEKETDGADELKTRVAGAATDAKQARQQIAEQEANYWHQAEAQAVAGSKDQMKAHEEYLNWKEQADLKALASGATRSHAASQTEVATFEAKKEAAKGNYDEQMRLEDEQLAFLASKYGQDSAQYQKELKVKEEMEFAHNAAIIRSAEEAMKAKEKLQETELQTKIKELNEEVNQGKLTRDEAIEQIKSLVDANATADATMLDDLEENLTKGTDAWRKAEEERAQLAANTAKTIASLNAQEAASDQKTAQTMVATFTDAFGNIGSRGATTISGLISGSMTWQQAERKMVQTVLSDFINMSETMLSRWVVTQLAETQSTQVQTAVRNAQNNNTSSGFSTLVQQMLGQWTNKETQQTQISLTGNSTRQAATQAAGAMQEATNASTAASSIATTAATTETEITAQAGVGAAGAFASLASIPYIGPFIAPAAAAAAMAAIMSFAKLDVGAYDVPQDMHALIHKGEMVIPQNFADGLRQSGSLMGGGSSTVSSANHFSPTLNFSGSAALSKSDVASALATANKGFHSYINDTSRKGAMKLPGRGLS